MNLDSRNIVFSTMIRDLEAVNSSFDRGKMQIAYHGRNANDINITKEGFERSLKSIFNCPIVCNYDRELDTIGAHDVGVAEGDDGQTKMLCLTEPVGVIPESARTWWETIEEQDGESHEYLCCDALFWKRQDAYAHIKNNKITDESMEITVIKSHRDDDNVYWVDEFEFRAFCLLESAPPCFESACVELFSLSGFRETYMSMMEDFKKEFSSVTISASADSDVEGGKHILDITKLIEEYGLSDTDVTFDYSQMEEAEIRERLAALKEAGQEVGQPEPPASGRPDGVGNNFSLTAEQFRSELRNAIGQEKYVPKWACCCEEYPRYTLEDYDTESCQAIVYDCKLYQICGLTYLVDKDSVTVDFKSRVRKKIVYADFEDGSAALISIEPDSLFSNVMAETERIVADKDKTIKSLSEFKEKTEHEKLENAVQDIFSKFNELSDDAKFNELIENHSGMTAEEVEEKCFALLGRKKCSDVKNFSEQSERSIVTPPFAYDGDHGAQADEPYGGLYAKHGKKPI